MSIQKEDGVHKEYANGQPTHTPSRNDILATDQLASTTQQIEGKGKEVVRMDSEVLRILCVVLTDGIE